jgi:Ca2+-binding EF-hand superfamily protein
VYGKVIKICDCDAFTRNYFVSVGQAQPGPIEQHNDPWTQLRGDSKVKIAAQARTYEKLYREVQLGGGHINENMQQFMENDRQVCRFFAVLDDVATEQYERRPFTILYFLSNNSVEIRERYPLNCGRDNFPIFLKRAKLPSGKTEARGPQDLPHKDADYVQVTDFAVGGDIALIHHQFLIYDADEFTRGYFTNQLGIELSPKVDVSLMQKPVPKPPTPPYTGYGSWDDSMSSVLHLIPKVPRKDFHKLYNNDGKVLRFTAKFVNPKSEDMNRFFVINFHLFDDTMSIHEPPQRNLGIVTGKFLEKGVHLNQATGKLFEPEDFLPGSHIKVFNHEMEVMEMDEYTKKYFSAESTESVDLQAVLEKLRESMRQQFPLVRDIFRRFDTDHNGVITLNEFKQALQKYGFMLSDEEVLVIMRHFDKRQDGQVTYNEFCDALLDEDYTVKMLKTKPGLDTSVDPSYSARAEQKSHERGETEKIRKATKEIGDVMYKHSGAMQKLFKEFTHLTHQNYVTCEQVCAALEKIGYPFDMEDIQRCILFIVPEVDLNCIDYVHFVKSLVACYHDLSASR